MNKLIGVTFSAILSVTACSEYHTAGGAGSAPETDAAGHASIPSRDGTVHVGASGKGGVAERSADASDKVSVDLVKLDCTETLKCLIAASTLDECVAATLKVLNASSSETRATFARAFAACSSFSGCEYVQCTERSGANQPMAGHEDQR